MSNAHMTTTRDPDALYRAAIEADDAYSAELRRIFGKESGNARYDARGTSTPELRRLHDTKLAADAARRGDGAIADGLWRGPHGVAYDWQRLDARAERLWRAAVGDSCTTPFTAASLEVWRRVAREADVEMENARKIARAALRADVNEVQTMIDALREIAGKEEP